MAKILVGVCSWTDPTLLASGFYPEGVNNPEKRLVYYAQHFSLVEVDATYYVLPPEKTARLWAQRTPPQFTFNVKAFALFTQHPVQRRALPQFVRAVCPGEKDPLYYRDVPAEVREWLWQIFEQFLLPLHHAGKLGVVLFQFPSWFYPSSESQDYLRLCREKLSKFRLAVEFRNRWWLAEQYRRETIAFLRDSGLAYVCVDEPQGLPSSLPPLCEPTADIGLVRFHGRNKENWERQGITAAERFQYHYAPGELGEWLPRIKTLVEQCPTVHLLFNNCYSDWGIKNAHDLSQLLRSQPALFPDFIP